MVFGNGDGYGEEGGLIIEQTSSSLSHYEMMMLTRLLAYGLGVTDNEEDPYLLQIKNSLAEIKDTLLQSHQASEALRSEAQAVLDAQLESVQQYMQNVENPPPPDFYPFVSLPEGSQVKDLPDGNRLFTLSDGMILKTNDDHTISVIVDGEPHVVTPGPGTSVELSPGRIYELVSEWIETTIEQAGIEGLPISTQVEQLAEHRFSIDLAPYRLLLDQQLKTLSVINPSGSIDILGVARTEGVGETIKVRILADGAKGFSCADSGHGGLIEGNGTIHLSMKNGTSLVIRFSDSGLEANDGSTTCQELCNLECEERDL
ncbi:MAG: hypothetical protein DRH50_10555 [Deltaproteobacteria bacterium]|nr:MAG: hypothetical protein DRH50_10555 [Deltaproteobacteria bacterium]